MFIIHIYLHFLNFLYFLNILHTLSNCIKNTLQYFDAFKFFKSNISTYLILLLLKVLLSINGLIYTVFDVVQPPLFNLPCKFDKILVVGNFIEQIFILKILVLEITSKKIFLIFHFIRYDIAIIKQSSRYFFKKFLSSACFVIFNEVRQRNIFSVFFLYTWSSKVNSIFIISGPTFAQ